MLKIAKVWAEGRVPKQGGLDVCMYVWMDGWAGASTEGMEAYEWKCMR